MLRRFGGKRSAENGARMLGLALPSNITPQNRLVWGSPDAETRHHEAAAAGRDKQSGPAAKRVETSWCPARLPHLETETLLSNLSIVVHEIGTRIYLTGDARRATAPGSLQLFFVMDGHGICVAHGAEFAVRSGSLLIAPASMNLEFSAAAALCPAPQDDHDSTVRSFRPPRAGQRAAATPLTLACINLSVTSAAERRLFEQLGSVLVDHSGNPQVWLTFELLLAEIGRQHIGGRAIIESLTKNLLLMTMREQLDCMRSDNPLRLLLSEPQIARVVNAMTANPGQRFSVEELARLATMTPQAMSRRFEAIFGTTPSEYLQQLRLTLAATLLRETDLPVKTIAGKVGFASRSHFSRLFSKFSGCDPTAYRCDHAAARA